MPDLLYEIGCEELPATFVAPTMAQLESLFRASFAQARLWDEAGGGTVRAYGTPRRLVLHATGLKARQDDETLSVKGPSASVAFDAEGRPTKAALGFAQKNKIGAEDLKVVDGYVQANITRVGRSALEIAGELLPQMTRALTFPKAMRWGAGRLRFARPLRWLLALLDDQVIPFAVEHVAAGRTTRGHRFLSPSEADVPDVAAYFGIMREKSVLIDPEERRARIVAQAERLGTEAGGRVQIAPELLEENVNLTEFPTAVRGGFSPDFLTLPRPVLVTAMRKHQRYFPLVGDDGALLPGFVAVRNGGDLALDTVRAGFENVLAARFNDARFFDEMDARTTLSSKAGGTKMIVFQEKLGSVFQKSERLVLILENGGLLDGLEEEQIAALLRAAALCKADLASEMVKELPALQGIVGEEYARRDGEPEAVAVAVAEHYRPKGAGDPLPESPTGLRLAIADRLDTLAGYLGIGIVPTGTSDPYALRRAAAGLVALLATSPAFPAPRTLFGAAWEAYTGQGIPQTATREDAEASLLLLLAQRLDAALDEQGTRYDIREAVLATPMHSVFETQARARAVNALADGASFRDALAADTRLGNILRFARKEGLALPDAAPNPAFFEDDTEQALMDAVTAAAPALADALERADYAGALRGLAALRGPVDAFFEAVMVMSEDVVRRDNRLALLVAAHSLFLRLADFEKIVTNA